MTASSHVCRAYELIDTAPELPAGMRLADHDTYGRCIVSPAKGRLFDAYWCAAFAEDADAEKITFWEHEDMLTFVDKEPDKPETPNFLKSEEDYIDAPFGTVVANRGGYPLMKKAGVWVWEGERPELNVELAGSRREVLRWGLGK